MEFIEKMNDCININTVDIVAFDIFDTTLLRKTSPMEVLREWALELINTYNLNITVEKLLKARFCISRILKLKNIIVGKDRECKYSEMIFLLKMYLRIHGRSLDFLDTCLSIEESIEKKFTSLNLDIKQYADYCRLKGKKIICISDYYLPGYVVNNILLSKGFYVDQIFVSQDFLKQKISGKLYSYVSKQLGIEPHKILMIGDTKTSDFIKPQSLGLQSYYLENKLSDMQRNKIEIDFSIAVKKWDDYKKDDHSRIPFKRMSFLMFVFISRLYKQLKNDGKDYIFFMSREGEFFKKLFDCYQEIMVSPADRIRTYYFYISRRASLLPSVHSIEKESFSEIYKNYNTIRPSVFFKNLQLENNPEILKEFSELLKKDNEIDGFSNSNIYRNILGSSVFQKECLINSQKQRDLLIKYLDSFGEDYRTKGLNLLDVGYSGTSQNNIFRMFNKQIKISGYYMICKSSEINEDNKKIGLLYDVKNGKPEDEFEYNSAVVEMFCLASHCGVDSYRIENEVVLPVFHHKQDELDCYKNIISPLQNVVLNSFRELSYIIKNAKLVESEYYNYILKQYKHFIFNPTEKEMRLYLQIPFEDNFAIYRTYTNECVEDDYKSFSVKGLFLILKSHFRCLKEQNTHWIAAAMYKLNMKSLNILMCFFSKWIMSSFDRMRIKENKRKHLDINV